MKFISVIGHEGMEDQGLTVYTYYNHPSNALFIKRAWEKGGQAFANGTFKLLAKVQYEYDPEKETFDVTILEKKTAPPPKTIEINLAAKPKEGVTKAVKKKIPPLILPGQEIAW